MTDGDLSILRRSICWTLRREGMQKRYGWEEFLGEVWEVYSEMQDVLVGIADEKERERLLFRAAMRRTSAVIIREKRQGRRLIPHIRRPVVRPDEEAGGLWNEAMTIAEWMGEKTHETVFLFARGNELHHIDMSLDHCRSRASGDLRRFTSQCRKDGQLAPKRRVSKGRTATEWAERLGITRNTTISKRVAMNGSVHESVQNMAGDIISQKQIPPVLHKESR